MGVVVPALIARLDDLVIPTFCDYRPVPRSAYYKAKRGGRLVTNVMDSERLGQALFLAAVCCPVNESDHLSDCEKICVRLRSFR